MASAEEPTVTVNIKGPADLKVTVTIPADSTVLELKEAIAKEKPDVPADCQRLIYAGKVLKDEQPLTEYKLQDKHTVHLVKSSAKGGASAPSAGSSSSTTSAAAPASSSTGAATGGSPSAASASAARGVPSSFGAGQQFTGNPLAALNRADLAGPHMANIGRNMFAGTGMNPSDPNAMMNAMNDPAFQQHMRSMMRRPEVIDQMIAMNPQLAGMGPQVREMMQSDQFLDMLTNPDTMRRMAQVQAAMRGGGGAGSLFGGGGQQQTWPPPGAFGTPGGPGQEGAAAGGEGGAAGANNDPFAALGGLGGLGGMGGGGGFDPNMLSQMFGGGGGGGAGGAAGSNPFAGLGGFGGSPTPSTPADSRPPEVRYAAQLEQLQGMGFTDGQANLRALLLSGGSVEGAVNVLLGGGS